MAEVDYQALIAAAGMVSVFHEYAVLGHALWWHTQSSYHIHTDLHLLTRCCHRAETTRLLIDVITVSMGGKRRNIVRKKTHWTCWYTGWLFFVRM